jgi:hypothetical protein
MRHARYVTQLAEASGDLPDPVTAGAGVGGETGSGAEGVSRGLEGESGGAGTLEITLTTFSIGLWLIGDE